jgi:hypothetical protein
MVRGGKNAAPFCWQRVGPPKPTPVYDTYWQFAVRRQDILRRRLEGQSQPWTTDPILARYRFTNAYRASDRVSQYLIRNVIYNADWQPTDLVFRVLLFKIFNRIETWEYLREHVGEITYDEFDADHYGNVLTCARREGVRIYSPAYIMPSPERAFGFREKHRNHLALLTSMLESGVSRRVCEAESLREVFQTLSAFPGLGPFLAFQYAIDLNYSPLTYFDEMDFVVAGPGAKDGLAKCFVNYEEYQDADLVKLVADRQELEFQRRGLKFESLGGRRLQLVDCQNLFCEIAKYARIRHPEYPGTTGRNKIKQTFRPRRDPVTLWFPPKWRMSEHFPCRHDH